jgi:hypothetical protein
MFDYYSVTVKEWSYKTEYTVPGRFDLHADHQFVTTRYCSQFAA